jgi:hypothetical protein
MGASSVGTFSAKRRVPKDPLGDDEVLDGERHAVEGPEGGPPAAERPLGRARRLPRLVGRDRHERVELRIHARDPLEHAVDDLHRRDLSTPDEGGQVRRGQPAELVGRHTRASRSEVSDPACRGAEREHLSIVATRRGVSPG